MKHIKIIICLYLAMVFGSAVAQIPKVSSGSIERIENFQSKYVTPRHVDIWLPDNYSISRNYSVLYMHDGQMLYDSATTWNKQAWEVDKTASELMKSGATVDFIVVGIWNGGETRHPDYFPQKPYEGLSKKEKQWVRNNLEENGRISGEFQVNSDNYLKFLVRELKPMIDERFNVHTDAENTFIAGSSMGGLISMYALAEYPNVFGGAACLSTHWPGVFDAKNNPIPDAFENYLKKKIRKLVNKKLYFDHGDQTLDAMYPPLQASMDTMMQDFCSRQKKPKADKCQSNWVSRSFPGTDHSENSWAERLHIPLKFLLGKP